MPAAGLPLQTSSRAPRLRRQRGRVPLESLVIYTLAFVLPFAAVITHMITVAFGIAAFVLLVIPVLRTGVLRIRSEILAPAALLMWMGLSLAWTYSPARAVQAFALMFSIQAFLFLFARVRNPRRTIQIYTTAALCLATGLVLIVTFIMVTVGTLRPPSVRTNWMGPISTRAAAEATLLIPVMFYLAERRLYKWLPYLMIVALIGIGILTQSRSGLAAVMLSTGLSFLFITHAKVSRLGIALSLIPVIVGAAVLIVPTLSALGIQIDALDRLLNTDFVALATGGAGAGSLDVRSEVDDWGRLVMYTVGIDLIDDFSLIGAGLFSTGPIAYERFGHFVQAHNVIIIMVGELGLIGASIATFYLFTLWRFWHRIRVAYARDQNLTLFVKMLAIILLLGLMLAQYKTMQGNLMFFGAIGSLLSLTGWSRAAPPKG